MVEKHKQSPDAGRNIDANVNSDVATSLATHMYDAIPPNSHTLYENVHYFPRQTLPTFRHIYDQVDRNGQLSMTTEHGNGVPIRTDGVNVKMHLQAVINNDLKNGSAHLDIPDIADTVAYEGMERLDPLRYHTQDQTDKFGTDRLKNDTEPGTEVDSSRVNNDYLSRMMPVANDERETTLCAGCRSRIIDRYYLLVADNTWHVQCLRCHDCNAQLDSQLTCFARGGNIFCKGDYYRRYSTGRCCRCQMGVASSELVMRVRDLIYHVTCFTCVMCQRLLTTGDRFGLQDDLLYCQSDYELLMQREHESLVPGHGGIPGAGILCYNGLGSVHKGRPRKRKNALPPGEGCLQSLGIMTNEHGELIARDYGSSHSQRQKRVRTSFKHNQLRTMKSYFALNHNPDAKDLKQLSEKTQLNKRVLQVWFQNARAKNRRHTSREDGDDKINADGKSSIIAKDSEQMLDLSHRRSPTLSDASSNQSMTESLEFTESNDQSGDSLTELFSDSLGSH